MFNGTRSLSFYSVSPSTNKYRFRGAFSNDRPAPEGNYNLLVQSSDLNTGIPTYNEFKARVKGHLPNNPVDVTPPWLNFSPSEIAISGQYAYCASGGNGVHIFDISNPANPQWINKIEGSDEDWINDIFVNDNYAFIAADHKGLQIADIDPPETASIINTVADISRAKAVCISGNYAYVADSYSGLYIVDIESIPSAYIVKNVAASDNSYAIFSDGEYAYLGQLNNFRIIDVNPPSSAYIVRTIDHMNCESIQVAGGYAYVAHTDKLAIIDVDPPQFASVVKEVGSDLDIANLFVSGDYAYLACKDDGIVVADINPPLNTHFVKNIDTPGLACDVSVSNGYAYIADSQSGLIVADIDPLSTSYIVSTFDTMGTSTSIDVSGNYAVMVNSQHEYKIDDFKIVDISDPASPRIAKSMKIDDDAYAQGVKIINDYACVVTNKNVKILDINPPESAHVVKTFDLVVDKDFDIKDGYAYIPRYNSGLTIFDFNPINSAHIVKTVNTPVWPTDVKVVDGYAYIAHSNGGLTIVDIDPPESAFKIVTVPTSGSIESIDVKNGYAYLSGMDLTILDVKNPVLAHIEGTSIRGGTDLYVDNGFAYEVNYSYGLSIVNVGPAFSPLVLTALDFPGSAVSLDISNNYAYVASGYGGLRIIKLW